MKSNELGKTLSAKKLRNLFKIRLRKGQEELNSPRRDCFIIAISCNHEDDNSDLVFSEHKTIHQGSNVYRKQRLIQIPWWVSVTSKLLIL